MLYNYTIYSNTPTTPQEKSQIVALFLKMIYLKFCAFSSIARTWTEWKQWHTGWFARYTWQRTMLCIYISIFVWSTRVSMNYNCRATLTPFTLLLLHIIPTSHISHSTYIINVGSACTWHFVLQVFILYTGEYKKKSFCCKHLDRWNPSTSAI